ncbi:hypothetical protein [Amycolatopsis keratiniphila]|uniref:Uncharacterized protein n=1 Tax=Amycolatopsis keratiniphila TaxID=129921 RepID=R4T3U8_9PSEU|nr:hypothetical protein [Amycolatopsis keratiniphila]AGM07091.1 hypothetical protein AORI_4507 [Amycolatopsis keratiniphila]
MATQDADRPEDTLAGRVGTREVQVLRSQGRPVIQRLDPGAYRCSRLAAQLADEWMDYVAATEITSAPSGAYRRGIDLFCIAVDTDPEVNPESTDLETPQLARVLARWERQLPAAFSPGSRWAAFIARALRVLIIRRDDHPDRPVADEIVRFARGPAATHWRESSERDEFSRHDKRALIKAAWAEVNALEHRLDNGWQLAAQGRHPKQGSWLHPPDLLWGISRGTVAMSELRAQLPSHVGEWPEELRRLVAGSDGTIMPNLAKRLLIHHLTAQLYPNTMDLHAFRVLLMDATGLSSEEVTSFGVKDVEFLPQGVRLTIVKKRAGRVRHRAFRDGAPQPGGVEQQAEDRGEPATEGPATHDLHDRPRREVTAIIQRLLKVTANVRERLPEVEDSLFVRAAFLPNYALVFRRWDPDSPRTTFSAWLTSVGVEVSRPAHIGRLRKSTKVEKAIVARGRVGIAADDHTRETFAAHYAQGTTLRIISGEVITAAQRHWFDKAITGPIVITPEAEAAAGDSARLQELGLPADQAEGIVTGQLDMGLSHCKDPYDSPFSSAGELCSVAPLRCLECRNAWILPSHLPQLLLFEQHLENTRRRMPPDRFTTIWGQTYTNLRAVLADRTVEEKALAHKHIDAGTAALHLPLTAHQEFDR